MMEVLPLFSTPVAVAQPPDMPDVLDRIFDFAYVPYSYGTGGDRSVNQDILSLLPDLATWLEPIIGEYMYGYLGIDSELHQIEVTAAWVNRYKKGDAAVPHVHQNSMYSGNIFLQGTTGDFVVERIPHRYMQPTVAHNNVYSSTQWNIKAVPGSVVLFPSDLIHYTKPNEEDTERITLSFNLFVRGRPAWVEEQFAKSL